MRSKQLRTAYYFTLDKSLEPELEIFARRCLPRCSFVYKDDPRAVTIVFANGEDASLFMNLFDGEIRDEYKAVIDDTEDGIAHAAA